MATESNPPGSEEMMINVVGERVALGPLPEDLFRLYGRWLTTSVPSGCRGRGGCCDRFAARKTA